MRRPPGSRGLFRRQVGTDTDVALWNAAVIANGGTVSGGRISLISSLVGAWKAAGCWSLLDDAWLLTAENSVQALTSLKQLRLATATNSPTFTADRGYAFDGATNYINTEFIPSSHSVVATATAGSIGVYERTNAGVTAYALAAVNSSVQNLLVVPRSSSNQIYGQINSQATDATSATTILDSRGLTVSTRNGGSVPSSMQAYKNGAAINPVIPGTLGSSLCTVSVYIGGSNNNGTPSGLRNSTIGFGFVGGYIPAAQQLPLYNALQTFMTAIGANV